MRWDRFEQDTGCCGDYFGSLTGSYLALSILSFLATDLHALFRARCVCKSWYDAVLSPQFIALCAARRRAAAAAEPWVLLRARTEAPSSHIDFQGLFDPRLHYAFFDYDNQMEGHVQLWLPRSGKKAISSFPLGPSRCFVGLASSAGLVCGRLMEDKDVITLVVGNPLTRQWKTLPPVPVDAAVRPCHLTVVFVSSDAPSKSSGSSSYMVTLFEVRDNSPWTVVYRSQSSCWETGPGFDVCDAVPDAKVEVLVDALAFVCSQEPLVAALDASSTAWTYVRTVCPPQPQDEEYWGDSSVIMLQILKHHGKCILAGLFHKWLDADDEWLGFGVWELDLDAVGSSLEWKLLSRISVVDLFGVGCKPDTDSDLKLQLAGGFVFFSAWYKNSTFGSWPPVAYELSSSHWHCYKDRPAPGHSYSPDIDFEYIYAFVPSLEAQP